jgi:CBS-domain-containing membrane protein
VRVKDVMTPNVICIDADEPVLKAARLMLQNHISGLPVLDKEGELVGMVTEGDFLRRGELGTQRRQRSQDRDLMLRLAVADFRRIKQ